MNNMQTKTRLMAAGLLSLILLGALITPYLRRESAHSVAPHTVVAGTQPAMVPETAPQVDAVQFRSQGDLTLSPAFNKYAEATDYVERTESLRLNLLVSLKHIAHGLQVDDQAKQGILSLIEAALDEAKIRENLARSLAGQLTEQDVQTLTDLFEHPVAEKVRNREDALMQQNPETMARFLEQYQDAEAFKLAQEESLKIIEDLQLWQDTQALFHRITDQLLVGLNSEKQSVSPQFFQQTTAALLASQHEALTLSTMYLYQDLNDRELKQFKEIYKNPAAAKERQIVFNYFAEVFGHIGTSMGRLAAHSQPAK
jgi:hypothetical protein